MQTAKIQRERIAKASREWIASQVVNPENREADIDLELHLVDDVLTNDDILDEIWSDSPETLMLRVNGSTIIEIDVESGNYLRGEADE